MLAEDVVKLPFTSTIGCYHPACVIIRLLLPCTANSLLLGRQDNAHSVPHHHLEATTLFQHQFNPIVFSSKSFPGHTSHQLEYTSHSVSTIQTVSQPSQWNSGEHSIPIHPYYRYTIFILFHILIYFFRYLN